MTFRVGQKVVQVRPWSNPDTAYPDVRFTECGPVYTIRAIADVWGCTALWFDELRNPPHAYNGIDSIEQPFPAWNFRPVVERKTSIEIFQQMLNPSRVEANA